MSDEQPTNPTPDDTEPSPERQTELREAYEQNVAEGKAPYQGVRIRTRGELLWVMRERDWSGERNSEGKGRANFNGARFQRLNLNSVHLIGASMTGADLQRTDLSFALLLHANLSTARFTAAFLAGANLWRADLSAARLFAADLSMAGLRQVNLRNANLRETDLSGANLGRADLSSADLRGARMSATTALRDITLDRHIWLGDVVWNNVPLSQANWEQMPRLGDEADIKAATTRQARIKAYIDAARAYRGLAKALQAQGLTDLALRYHTRQYQLERKALFWQFKVGPWVFSWLLNLVSGYGDRPGRALVCYIAVVGAFAAAYYSITNGFLGITSHSTQLQWYEALVLSISSFHGRGLFPSVPTLGDPVAIVAAAEAIIGLFIELVFIATFTQRFFAR